MAANEELLSIDQKLEICKRLKKVATITSLLKELNIGKSTSCHIKQNSSLLLRNCLLFDYAYFLILRTGQSPISSDNGLSTVCFFL